MLRIFRPGLVLLLALFILLFVGNLFAMNKVQLTAEDCPPTPPKQLLQQAQYLSLIHI